MSLFGGSKPRVDKREYRETKESLRRSGFTNEQMHDIDNLMQGSMNEKLDSQKGIDASEIKKTIDYMRKNKSKHSVSDSKLNELEKALKKRL